MTSASLGYWAILKVPDDATDDAGDVAADSAFGATGGVVHDDAPTPAPTPAPSPACKSSESLYRIWLSDSGGDGWEGTTYRVVDTDIETKAKI